MKYEVNCILSVLLVQRYPTTIKERFFVAHQCYPLIFQHCCFSLNNSSYFSCSYSFANSSISSKYSSPTFLCIFIYINADGGAPSFIINRSGDTRAYNKGSLKAFFPFTSCRPPDKTPFHG